MGIIETLTSHWGFSVLAVLAVVIILCATLGKVEEDKIRKPIGIGACGLFMIVLGFTCTTLNIDSNTANTVEQPSTNQEELPEEIKNRPQPIIDYVEDIENVTDDELIEKVAEITEKLNNIDFSKYNEAVNRHANRYVDELNQAGDLYHEDKSDENKIYLITAINQNIDLLSFEVTDENLIK